LKKTAILLLLSLSACLGRRNPPETETRFRPAGVVRIVNSAERYLIFESFFAFAPGQELSVMHKGRKSGVVRVLELRKRPQFAADLLEGSARPGDIVEF
jgi:hypothetical protein